MDWTDGVGLSLVLEFFRHSLLGELFSTYVYPLFQECKLIIIVGNLNRNILYRRI